MKFPKRAFGKRNRAFQSVWFKEFPWLHYLDDTDVVLCHTCTRADERKFLFSVRNADRCLFIRRVFKLEESNRKVQRTPRIKMLQGSKFFARPDGQCVQKVSIESSKIHETYDALVKLWDECLDTKLDTEMRAMIIGVRAQTLDFNYYFGVNLGERLFSMTDNYHEHSNRRECLPFKVNDWRD